MDEMKVKLSTKFMRGMIAKLLSRLIRNKLGYDIDIEFSEIEIKTVDGNIRLHMNADAVISNDEFIKIIKDINKD